MVVAPSAPEVTPKQRAARASVYSAGRRLDPLRGLIEHDPDLSGEIMLNIRLRGAFAVVAGVLLITHKANAADDVAARCNALKGASLPAAAIGLPTTGATIASAAMTDASDPNGVFCKIVGAIHPVDKTAPDINYQINVPSAWNGKALHLGGGGYDGTVVTGLTANFLGRDVSQPLKRGYATFGSDSGHKGSGGDASFGANDEALANFGGDQLKKTHDVAVELIKRVAGQAPRRMYFEGNSQGGHEGFNVVQRWPRDYDGVVSIHPVYDITALQLDGVHVGQALYNSPGAWLSPAKTKLIYDTVMKACDSLDGAADGVIANVKGCRTAFKLDSLRCADGKDAGDMCLSDAQIGTVRTIASRYQIGFALEDGVSSFAPWPLIEGGSAAQIFNFGAKPTASNPPAPAVFGPPGSAPPSDAFAYVMGDAMVRHMALRDPKVDTLKFDATQHEHRLKQVSKVLDASSVALEPFRDRGGKLLLLHGTADMAVPPQNTIDYYERLVARFGADKLEEFVRFYVVPGFGHGDGPFQASWDWLSALDAWVEKGQAPASLVAVDTAMATAGRSRPLCEYPAWPKYKGSGDVSSAASFACTAE
jgi:feruloyl esterase